MSINSTEIEENSDLTKKVEESTDLKSLIVNYVGNTLDPENQEVTLEMVIGVFAAQFPEFMLTIAEENWVRGYKIGLEDADVALRASEAEQEVVKSN
jgi:hypothetical protein